MKVSMICYQIRTKKNDYIKLIKHCQELDIDFTSTPYNKEYADF